MIHKILEYKSGLGKCACGAIHTERIYQYGKDLYHVPKGASKSVIKIRRHIATELHRISTPHYATLLVAGTLKSLAGIKTRSVNDRIRVDRCISALADCLLVQDMWVIKTNLNHAAEQLL